LRVLPGDDPADNQQGPAQCAGGQVRDYANTSSDSRSLASDHRRSGGAYGSKTLHVQPQVGGGGQGKSGINIRGIDITGLIGLQCLNTEDHYIKA